MGDTSSVSPGLAMPARSDLWAASSNLQSFQKDSLGLPPSQPMAAPSQTRAPPAACPNLASWRALSLLCPPITAEVEFPPLVSSRLLCLCSFSTSPRQPPHPLPGESAPALWALLISIRQLRALPSSKKKREEERTRGKKE